MTPGHDQLEARQLLSGFQAVTSVSGLTPNAVAAISPTDVVAVGSGTLANGDTGALIETFNGTTWCAATVPAESTGVLNGVSASSSSNVFAVGDTVSNGVSTPLVEFFNGTTWTVQATPSLGSTGGGLNSVTAISPTDVWAVGGGDGGQLIEHFNGTSWSVVASPVSGRGDLDSISAANADDIFAVGSISTEPADAVTLQFNGTTWNAVANGPSGTHSVDAISATDVWAVGGAGGTGAAVWNFDGTAWTEVTTLDGQLTAVSGSLSNDVYVVGEGDLVEQWNGTSFNVVSATGTAGFTGVATLSNGTAFAVGGNGIEQATTSVPTTTIPTTTALTSSASSAPFGGSVTLTATITPSSTGSAAPMGSVAFFDGSTLIGGGDVSGDVATLVTTSLPVGTNSITATYEGDSNYAVSTSQAVSTTITQATTTTSVSFSPVSPVLGQDTTLTAAITPTTTGPVAPSGTVEFFDGSTLLGSGTVSGDSATLVTTALPVGTSTLTATYEGDGNYSASTSPGVSVTVVSAATPASPPFQLMTSPTVNGSLSAVSAVSATDIWAVGFQNTSNGDVAPLTENFNGTSWSVVAAPTPAGASSADFNAVSALASNNVWAVGNSDSVNSSGVGVSTPLVEHFNGTSWSIQTIPATAGSLNAVTAISPTDVWAVGGGDGGQLIEHFNGTSWSVVASPVSGDGDLDSISAVNANDIFAVGSVGEGREHGASTLQFNGTTWSAVANGPTGTFSVDAISATDVWAVGGAGGTGAAVWNFNGTAWTEVTTLPGQLTAVSGSSPNDVYVVGEGDLVEQWNGASFNVVSATGTAGFTGVATLSNGTAFAVGGNGIETNATTAAPAVSVATTGGSASGAVVDGTASPPQATTTAAATKPASSVSDAVTVPPAVATTNAVVMGTLETPSSTLGTKKHGFTS
jgi:hypothetical protein